MSGEDYNQFKARATAVNNAMGSLLDLTEISGKNLATGNKDNEKYVNADLSTEEVLDKARDILNGIKEDIFGRDAMRYAKPGEEGDNLL
jgi:hypothetical protein